LDIHIFSSCCRFCGALILPGLQSCASKLVFEQKNKRTAAAGFLEVVSKPQIRFKGKAQADRESAAYE
jgi:hypothetical protein